MGDTAAEIAARQKLNNSGNSFMAGGFRMVADIIKSFAGASFKDDDFVAHVGNLQINRIGPTNDAGSTITLDSGSILLRACTAGVWNTVSWQIVAPSDRFRVILGLKITLFAITAGGNVVGNFLVPDALQQQLIARGQLQVKRSRGVEVQSKIWQFMTSAANTRFQTPALAGGAQAIQNPIAEPRLPSEQEILPLGFQAACFGAIDAINPLNKCNFTFNGLDAVAATGGYTNDIGFSVDAIVWDAVMSGQ